MLRNPVRLPADLVCMHTRPRKLLHILRKFTFLVRTRRGSLKLLRGCINFGNGSPRKRALRRVLALSPELLRLADRHEGPISPFRPFDPSGQAP